MKIGYLRSSGADDPAVQRRELLSAGVDEIFEDVDVPPSAVFKPAYVAALKRAKAGDVLVVCGLDRLASTVGTLLLEVQFIERLGLGLSALSEGMQTAPDGEFFRHARMLEGFQRGVAAVRRAAEISADPALETPVRKGGQPALVEPEEWEKYRLLMLADKSWTLGRVAKELGISRQAVHKRFKVSASQPHPR